jgi:hypothetical protein
MAIFKFFSSKSGDFGAQFLTNKSPLYDESHWIFFGHQICEGGLLVGDHAQEDLAKLQTNFPQRLQAFLQIIIH